MHCFFRNAASVSALTSECTCFCNRRLSQDDLCTGGAASISVSQEKITKSDGIGGENEYKRTCKSRCTMGGGTERDDI